MPRDRVARHRLARELIDSTRLADAEAEIRAATAEVGLDPPLQRYKVKLAVARSRNSGLLLEDRKAILQHAFAEAEYGILKFPDSKYMYFAAADVAEGWFHLTSERGRLEWVKQIVADAHDRLLDPDLGDRLRKMAVL